MTAITMTERGHVVSLFDSCLEIGGQFNLAKKIPGKEEFQETIRYFKQKIQLLNINLELNLKVDLSFLKKGFLMRLL